MWRGPLPREVGRAEERIPTRFGRSGPDALPCGGDESGVADGEQVAWGAGWAEAR
jgi:hypothetical protein